MARRMKACDRLMEIGKLLMQTAARGYMDIDDYKSIYAIEPSIIFNMARNLPQTVDRDTMFGGKLSDRESKLRDMVEKRQLTTTLVLGAL